MNDTDIARAERLAVLWSRTLGPFSRVVAFLYVACGGSRDA